MKLLLDTHIWLWALLEPNKINRDVQRQLNKPASELYLSPVSIWETYHLARRKRIIVGRNLTEWLDQMFAQIPLREAPFNFAVAMELCRIDLPQADLGDLLIAATASVFDLTLVTSDQQLIHCNWLKTLANG
jgi:PIN domain nuclease of toxin-antitoxin system